MRTGIQLRLAGLWAVIVIFAGTVLFATAAAAGSDKPDAVPYIDSQIDINSSSRINIIIELTDTPLAVKKSEADENKTVFETAAAEKELRDEAEAFLNYLENKGIDYSGLERFEEIFNGFSMEVSARDIEKLAQFDGVTGVYPDQEYEVLFEDDDDYEPTYDENKTIEVSQLWDLGLTGAGIKIGVIDTGIDYHHPDLEDAYKGGKNYVNDGQTTPLEGHGSVTTTHGTNVSGIIAGRGSEEDKGVKGVAFESDLYVYRVIDNNDRGRTADLLKALEQASADSLDILNLSLSSKVNEADTPLTRAINQTVKSGMVVVVANGNAGPGPMTVGDPGTAASAISVAAASLRNGAESLAPFSSRGPVNGTYDIKPDIIAPGYSVYSATSLSRANTDDYSQAYGYYNGTSMAAPFITGVAALLLEADRSQTAQDIKAKIMNTGVLFDGGGVNEIGAGAVRAMKALETPVTATVQDTIRYRQGEENKELVHRTGSINFGSVEMGGYYSQEKTLELMNTSNQPVEYKVSWRFLKDSMGNEGVSLDMPERISVGAGGTADMPVVLKGKNTSEPGYYEGYLTLSADGYPELTLPFGVEVGTVSSVIESAAVSPDIFNSGRNSVEVTFELSEDVYGTEILLSDEDGSEEIGIISPFTEGGSGKSFNWDLTYTDNASGDTEKVADGKYTVQLKAYTSPFHYFLKDVPVHAYSVTPEIELLGEDLSDNHFSGKIKSYFSDEGEASKALSGGYTLENSGGVYRNGDLEIEDDGSFAVTNKLRAGETTVTIEVTDRAGNAVKESFLVNWSGIYQKGDQGEGVKQLKQNLGKLGFESSEDPADYFGDGTEKALEKFQAYYSVPVTGKADEDTQNKLDEQLSTIFMDGNADPAIRELKVKLTHLGFGNFPERPSDRYGPVTSSVVDDFQKHYGLTVNGIADDVTLGKMDAEWDKALKDGDDSEAVREMKMNLTALGFGNFPEFPSTRYGPVTSGVVSDFQESHSLRVSGTANPITLKKIEELLQAAFKDGDDHPDIRPFKQKLTALGYGNFPERPSTRYGPVTEGVVKEFQADNGLQVTGTADHVTMKKIDELLQIVFEDGDDLEEIRALKQDLTFLGFGNFPNRPSTRYGPVTEGVVKDFQKYYGLPATGVVNVRTLDVLKRNINTIYQDGKSTAEIREMKMQLTSLGFGNFPESPSKNYGPVTAGVVRDFQQHHNLIANGIADTVTLNKIYR
ncbi:peptidoglycan-binding protein [Salipaludibacillus aurantiacus]|uniref:Peptidase inhibitor I9 n=1 Tax=Salipaludibacillus aurantiacus TaxID=1601833 RepID=A0A1H9X4U7_9BACI|nr:peptidoglycan-binding protein [Salipaludibacillus aurantiacus]SES41175.1 Peptidase inhibitor I9 [Salipaludibacillus aurantiacus]